MWNENPDKEKYPVAICYKNNFELDDPNGHYRFKRIPFEYDGKRDEYVFLADQKPNLPSCID